MSENYDDYDFVPTSNSSLSSLFNNDSGELLLSNNPSLIYTAPKQPKKVSTYYSGNITKEKRSESSSSSSSKSSKIICALVATIWKWLDCKYESLGKLGVAIIGIEEIYNSYELIIYKSKTNIIVQIKINQNFEITINKGAIFLTFYDNSKQNWLIKFDTDKELTVITEIIEKYGGKIIKKFEEETQETSENSNKQQQQHSPSTLDGNNEIEENRADILTRIAKLGQSILPNQDIKPTIIEETEDDSLRTDHNVASILSNDDRINQPIIPPTKNNINITPIQTRQSLCNSLPTTTTTTTSFIMNSNITYDPISMLFTENRTNSNEIRLNLNQITDKLNKLLQIVSDDDNKKLNNNNNNNNNTNEELLKCKMKVLQLKIENLNREIEGNAIKYSELQQKYDKLKQTTNEQENGNLNIQHPTDKKEQFIDKIKQAMSAMYDNITCNFELNQENNNDVLINIIAQNIKQTTKMIVHQYQEIHNNDNN